MLDVLRFVGVFGSSCGHFENHLSREDEVQKRKGGMSGSWFYKLIQQIKLQYETK